MTRRAVVIGAGAIGMASAHYLSLDGWQVTLIDRGEFGRGCSYANACLITPSHSRPLPGPGVMGQVLRWMLRRDSPVYVKPRLDPGFIGWAWRFWRVCRPEAAKQGSRAMLALGRLSLTLFEDLARTLGVPFFFQRKGLLHVYLSDEGMAAARRERDLMQQEGFAARLLTRDETVALEPGVSPRVRAGLYVEGDAHGDSFSFVRAVAAGLEARGARLMPHRAVERIVVRRGRVEGVMAAAEEIPADLVVLAAGAWTPALTAPLGIHLPMQPAKGYSCTIAAYPGAPTIPLYVPERRIAVTPLGDRMRFGGTLELAGYGLEMNAPRYQAVVRAGREVLNDAVQWKNEEAWSGLRPLLPDGLPIIDRARGVDGLIIAAGHAMLGFTQSPGTGKVVADLAGGGPPAVPLDAFRLDRFQ